MTVFAAAPAAAIAALAALRSGGGDSPLTEPIGPAIAGVVIAVMVVLAAVALWLAR